MDPIPPPDPAPPLRLPDRALPPYRYVPGLNPHPFRHPLGHLYTGGGAPDEPDWDPALPWGRDPLYLRGQDLFDQRYYWESHEVWEVSWRRVARETPLSALLQGLIQASAFTLKHHLGHRRSAERLLASSRARLLGVRARVGADWRGLNLEETAARLEAFAAGGPWPTLARARPSPGRV